MGKKTHIRRNSKRSRKRRARFQNTDRTEGSVQLDIPLSYYYDYDDPPDYSESDNDLIYREDDTINMRATKWD